MFVFELYAFDCIWMRYIGVNTAGSAVSVVCCLALVQQVTLFHSIASCCDVYAKHIL